MHRSSASLSKLTQSTWYKRGYSYSSGGRSRIPNQAASIVHIHIHIYLIDSAKNCRLVQNAMQQRAER
eukprot:scaffold94979_cov24-Attheya_sp.AAC.1